MIDFILGLLVVLSTSAMIIIFAAFVILCGWCLTGFGMEMISMEIA